MQNRLLGALSEPELDALAPSLERIDLSFKKILHPIGEPISQVYFPLRGVVSMVNEPNRGEIVEIATIGREGMTGLPLALSSTTMPSRCLVQVAGEALTMSAVVFTDFLETSRSFRQIINRYTLALLGQVAQNASCNRLHEVQERCARWLLQTHDRVDEPSFYLTQDFLAQMLGVHRPTVSIAAGMLQKAGFITYARGTIEILDRPGLEEAACTCYGVVAGEYERLVGAR